MNALEKIANVSPNTEVWWDSSPLVFDNWLKQTQKTIDENKLKVQKESLEKLYCKENLSSSVFQGVTTNPPLCLDVVKSDKGYWEKFIQGIKSRNSSLNGKESFWAVYSEIVKRGAEMYLPIFEKTKYLRGYISGQVDPRYTTDVNEMVKQGIILNQIHPNIMVKMPGTKEGVYGILILTSLGIPTNATLTFTLSQLIAVAEAVKAGLEIARKNNVDLSKWRSVVTLMLGRLEDCKEFAKQAKELNLELTDTDKRWFGLAVFKKAYKLYQQRGYESKLLAASMRMGPTLDGKTRIWHIEKLIGADAVLTIFPNIVSGFILNYDGEQISSKIDEPVPEEVLNKLSKIPYFKQAYEENGIEPKDFIHHAAVKETGDSFANSANELEGFCAGKN